jgi:ribosomal protein L37AE/L43A
LARVNPKGEPGIWECRPRCSPQEVPVGALRDPWTQTQCPGCDRWRLNLRTDGTYECEKCNAVYSLTYVGKVQA